MSELVFGTIHGSRLYGLGHAGSDYDYYQVVAAGPNKASHTIKVDDKGRKMDMVTVSMFHFLDLATSGSHQSVEALFSRYKHTGPAWKRFGPMLERLNIAGPTVYSKYERTIKSFSHGDLKKRRHAVRLAFNLQELRQDGKFNPKLSEGQIDWVKNLADAYEGDELYDILINGKDLT